MKPERLCSQTLLCHRLSYGSMNNCLELKIFVDLGSPTKPRNLLQVTNRVNCLRVVSGLSVPTMQNCEHAVSFNRETSDLEESFSENKHFVAILDE